MLPSVYCHQLVRWKLKENLLKEFFLLASLLPFKELIENFRYEFQIKFEIIAFNVVTIKISIQQMAMAFIASVIEIITNQIQLITFNAEFIETNIIFYHRISPLTVTNPITKRFYGFNSNLDHEVTNLSQQKWNESMKILETSSMRKTLKISPA